MELLFRHNGNHDMGKFDRHGEFWITRNGSLQKLNLILDNIEIITTSALQEVDMQLQAEKIKTASLESQMAILTARVDAMSYGYT
jgi:hypothetical protein